MRNLKALGLAFVAVLAMSGIAASAAQAEFTLGTGSNHVHGKQLTATFFTTFGEVECETGEGDGSVSGTTVTDLTFSTVTFEECTAFGQPNSDVKTNGCSLTVTTSGQESHILCPAGKSIEITPTTGGVSICTVHVFEHTVNGISFHNTTTAAGKMDILATVEATNLAYETTGGNGNCGTQNTRFTCGVFLGEITITASGASGATDITHSHPTT
jgi:hypothetical protein